MSPTSDGFGWAILAATFLGPIGAVLMTRYVDRAREKHARRLGIFRTLMATRRSYLAADHINALNQIELDFPKDRLVMEAYRNYMKSLAKPVKPEDNDRVAKNDSHFEQKYYRKWQNRYASMLNNLIFSKADICHRCT